MIVPKEVEMEHISPAFSDTATTRIQFSTTEFEPLLDSEQAAGLLRIHPKTLQKLARRGEIRGTHVGKLWRFRASDLNAWINRQQRVG